MNRAILVGLLLTSCSLATAHPEPSVNADAMLFENEWLALVYDGAQGNQRSLTVVQQRLDAQSPAAHQASVQAAQGLILNCPFNRSSVQMALALNQVAQRYDARDQPVQYRIEWDRIRQGLAQHVAVFESLEVAALPLPLPLSADHLGPYTDVLLTGEQLSRSPDPLNDTRPLLDATFMIVEKYDNQTSDAIDVWHGTLRDATGDSWPLKPQMRSWHNSLQRVLLDVEDPNMRADLQDMVDTLDLYIVQGC